ncbi:hypothetical protein SAMN05192529_11770 [Arachidicoccus rhizosphaerae]|uniref:Uncharacterized protein n=1 Tax=Arachidicoccus rhizosphaerae TaxID=551991 RepID=A0A1H4B043_9BACT|nr:hypothetical protein SAMN05192529_11770 [Arachidicoccus rhizosphaerae]
MVQENKGKEIQVMRKISIHFHTIQSQNQLDALPLSF